MVVLSCVIWGSRLGLNPAAAINEIGLRDREVLKESLKLRGYGSESVRVSDTGIADAMESLGGASAAGVKALRAAEVAGTDTSALELSCNTAGTKGRAEVRTDRRLSIRATVGGVYQKISDPLNEELVVLELAVNVDGKALVTRILNSGEWSVCEYCRR